MSNVLEQALVAAQQRNWSLLNQYLQQLPQMAAEPLSPDWEQVLNLALNVLEAGDFQDRWEVAKVLPKLGTSAIAPLIAIMEDEAADLELRWFAGRILGEFQHPAVVTALVDLLSQSEDEELVDMATATLGNIGISAIEALTDLLAQEDSRLSAVRSLAHIRHSATIAPLLSVVHDPHVAVRSTAIEALSSFHDARIPPVLLDALNDLAASVRKEAVAGLGLRVDLREELDLVNRLKPRLWDFNGDVCQQAAIALGRMGTQEAAEALFEVLKSPATPIPLQVAVVRAFPPLPATLEYLHQELTSTGVEVCQEVITVLGRIEQPDLKPQATQILLEFIHSQHPATQHNRIKQSLALALGQLGEQSALNPLIHLLSDVDGGVRLHAIAALKKLAPENAPQQLQQLAANPQIDPSLKQGIAIALAEWNL